MGHVAEFASANLWFAKDGRLVTPAINHTFLNGITRQRVLSLFRDKGMAVEERTVKPAELETADEIFSTGNYAKVQPCTRYNGRDMQIGRFATQARELYWGWMEAGEKVV
jgi:branched-chain amino acid aminotransferase